MGIGTKVICRCVTDSQRYEMSFVGAWEADATTCSFNYKTPLAKKLLGKRIGDTVELDHSGATGTYEIIGLENALAAQAD